MKYLGLIAGKLIKTVISNQTVDTHRRVSRFDIDRTSSKCTYRAQVLKGGVAFEPHEYPMVYVLMLIYPIIENEIIFFYRKLVYICALNYEDYKSKLVLSY